MQLTFPMFTLACQSLRASTSPYEHKLDALVSEMCKGLASKRDIKNRSDFAEHGLDCFRIILAPDSSVMERKILADAEDKLFDIFRQMIVKLTSKLLKTLD